VRGALRADGQIVDEHVDLLVAQHRDDLVVRRLLLVRHHEATVFGEVFEVVADAVEHASHAHAHARLGHAVAEYHRAIGLLEDRLGHVLADLAQVDVERGRPLRDRRAD
jgi:hypothetical protein